MNYRIEAICSDHFFIIYDIMIRGKGRLTCTYVIMFGDIRNVVNNDIYCDIRLCK